MKKNYRSISDEEIAVLMQNGCVADDWGNISVTPDFSTEFVRDVRFSGKIEIGALRGKVTFAGGVTRHSGIFNASLHNVTVGDNVYISNVMEYIANYEVCDRAVVENVGRIVCEGGSAFGNGVKVSVLNEAGGREVMVYDRMSAHLAYMLAMYRYHPQMIEAVNAMIERYAQNVTNDRGRIGVAARIMSTSMIKDVMVGDSARITGASSLENGTIAGSEKDPVEIGSNVIAKDFIVCSGARVEDGAVMVNTFVGQGSRLSHLFSAHDSLFFANCICENGEAAAIFGGPYTVSMHKSSLLIAGMFSFINAGSGSNQSNHMYKLGPIHQGIVERGSKTTSDSYILWPAKIGAFSLVMGRHVNHPDTSRLPFSYLIENKGRSYLVPGVNLKSVGTIRDAQKWPKRDKRKDDNQLDRINFNLLSPYTIGKMMDGIALLDRLEATSGITADCYSYQSMTIEPKALRKGREYYRLAIDKFMGNSIISRLQSADFGNRAEMGKALQPGSASGSGEWIDLCGLIAPKCEVSGLVERIERGEVSRLSEIEEFFNREHRSYYDMEWTWVVEHFEHWYGKPIEAVTVDDLIEIVKKWKESVVKIDKLLYDDARKEFSLTAKTSFGVDGSEGRQDTDFEQVRGAFEHDPFVQMVLGHIKTKSELGENVIARLQSLRES